MRETVISVENVSKAYHLGVIGTGTFRGDLQRWLEERRGRADPALKIGKTEHSDRTGETIWALTDLSFAVQKGEAVGVIGANGAGKSTLLKILSNLTAPTMGTVKLKGRIASLLEVGVGFHPELTGRENVYLSGAILGMPSSEVNRRFDEIVNFAGVEEYIDTPIKRYSTGMYVRLGFAVAAHSNAEVLIVDEVLAVGDLSFQKKCLSKMSALQREGCTTLLVTHNVSLLPGMASQVIWLESGRLMEIGDPGTVVSNYFRRMSSSSTEVSHADAGRSQSERVHVPKPLLIPEGGLICDPPEGRDGAQLIRAFVADENLRVLKDVDYEMPFYFVADYKVDSKVDRLRVGFRLVNERQQPILQAATVDNHPDLDSSLIGLPGHYRASAQLPGKWFVPGTYVVEVGLWSPSALHHFYKPDAFTFNIVNCPLESIGTETCRPKLDWKVVGSPS